MKKLIKLVSITSKKSFEKLRDNGDIFCTEINKDFTITSLFLKHISMRTRNRKLKEIIERLSSISMIEDISKNGKLVEVRKDIFVEKVKFFKKSYKIQLKVKNIDFYIILGEKVNGKVILISIFINYDK